VCKFVLACLAALMSSDAADRLMEGGNPLQPRLLLQKTYFPNLLPALDTDNSGSHCLNMTKKKEQLIVDSLSTVCLHACMNTI
jgi:hypothetical protein